MDGVVAANAAVGVAVCLVGVPGGVGTCWPASLDAVGILNSRPTCVLDSQLSIGFAQLLIARVVPHPEDLIVVVPVRCSKV